MPAAAKRWCFRGAAIVAATDEILTDNGVRAQGSPDMMAVWQAKPWRSSQVGVDQFRHFAGIGALHRPAVDRRVGRLADAVDGKHRGVDGAAIGLEAQRRIVDAAFRVHLDAPLVEFMRNADLQQPDGHRFGGDRRTDAD